MSPRRLAAWLLAPVVAVAGLTIAIDSHAAPAPPPVDVVTASARVFSPTVGVAKPSRKPHRRPVRRTTTTTSTVPASALCPDVWPIALAAGWPQADLPKVDHIVWRESRCTPSARSRTRDSGLMQINDVHLGWLAAHGITQAALFDPATNLRAGRLLWLEAARMYGCGWQPWNATADSFC